MDKRVFLSQNGKNQTEVIEITGEGEKQNGTGAIGECDCACL